MLLYLSGFLPELRAKIRKNPDTQKEYREILFHSYGFISRSVRKYIEKKGFT